MRRPAGALASAPPKAFWWSGVGGLAPPELRGTAISPRCVVAARPMPTKCLRLDREADCLLHRRKSDFSTHVAGGGLPPPGNPPTGTSGASSLTGKLPVDPPAWNLRHAEGGKSDGSGAVPPCEAARAGCLEGGSSPGKTPGTC
eukprot:7359769-Alexandrium_andersonii.AAC.1